MTIPRITAQQVRQRIERGERVALVDARSAKAYQEASEQIPGSVRIAPDDLDPQVRNLPRDVTVVAYCT
jgi:rhodanese-related sulfurtransferase